MEPEEITVPFGWGHIAAKWWGPKHNRPILVLHGWQDNAGSFDTLIPLLPVDTSFLAIDFPGHGLSSRLPNGLFYNYIDFVYLVEFLRVHFKWDHVSIMAHSMGSLIGFVYAGVFPHHIDLLISIDTLKPLVRHPATQVEFITLRGINLVRADERNREPNSEPPSYTYDELIQRMVEGTNGSVTAEAAKYLLSRGTKASTHDPNKYYFARDSRMKYVNEFYFDQTLCLELAKRIRIPHLFIKSNDSNFSEKFANVRETVQLLKKSNPLFQVCHVKGTHHVHLNNPERIADTITRFLIKHRDNAAVKSKL